MIQKRSVADYWRDPQVGGLCNKIPERLQRSLAFFVLFPQHCKHASVINQKIPFLRYAQEEDFVEVGGGFERLILLKLLNLLLNSLKRCNSAFKRILTVNIDKLNNRTIFLFLSPNMSPNFIN